MPVTRHVDPGPQRRQSRAGIRVVVKNDSRDSDDSDGERWRDVKEAKEGCMSR